MSSDGRLTAGSTSSSNSSSSPDSSAAPDSCDESSEVSLAEHDDVFAAEQSSSEEVDGPVDQFADLRCVTKQIKPLGKKVASTFVFWDTCCCVGPRSFCQVHRKHSALLDVSSLEQARCHYCTATDHGKKCLGKALKQVYGADCIAYYGIVAEQHASSSRRWERTWHWHAVLKLSRRVKWKAVAKNLRERGIYGRLALPQFHADIWRILRYVLCPSLKKSHSELDDDPYFSSTFPLEQMESKMRKFSSASFRPSDMFNALRSLRPRLTSYQELIAWAAQQRQRGNGKFQEFMARQGPKMQPLFLSWQTMLTETSTPRQREHRLRLWAAASQEACVCYEPSRLREALDNLLEHHGKSAGRFAFCILRLLKLGTAAKNNNLLLYGESNSGKTGLTRPLMHIFENRTFLRPNKGDTFPLMGLEQHLITVFQDWRLSSSPIPWDTLLLLLEGESVTAAVKGAGSVLVHSPPPVITTCQAKVQPRTAKGEIDEAERLAFHNRFQLRWHFKYALPQEQRDNKLKLCYRCKGCYSRWINDNYQGYIKQNPGIDSLWTSRKLLRGPALWRARRLCRKHQVRMFVRVRNLGAGLF